MSEYITKDAVFDLLHGQDELILFTRSYKENGSVGERLCNAITRIPAADVEPVVRGELRINEQGYLECSACGKTLRMPLVSTHEMKRCYICGAYLERSGSGE